MSSWEAIIGLEVHARLLTKSKIFCACSTEFGTPPNTNVCPVCLGYPGALPVLNRHAVDLAIRMALATECTIHLESIFARKNYFYPDLPKGYQISQFDHPLATVGRVAIRTSTGDKVVRIRRIHLEEDAGKLIHTGDTSQVDLNRSGVPLIEIVTEPDVESAEEATAYLTRLRQMLMYTAVCDGNMEEGSLRCDANVSVRRSGEPLGTRAEVKNLNSFRFLGRAVEFEIERQIAVIESGERIVQETRLYDPVKGETRAMRSKEEAHDYRYFPDPDLLGLHVDEAWIERVRGNLPELPTAKVARYQKEFGMPVADAEVLVMTREIAEYFEETVANARNPRAATNWVRNEVLGRLGEMKIAIAESRVRPHALAKLIDMIEDGAISGKAAKEVFDEMSTTGDDPAAIVDRKGLGQVTDPAAIRQAAEKILAANASQVEQYRAGKTAVFGFLVGQLMKETRGRAKPELANQILRELMGG